MEGFIEQIFPVSCDNVCNGQQLDIGGRCLSVDVYGVDELSSYASMYVIKSVLDILTIDRQRLVPKTGKDMNLSSNHVRL
jgi:hypothetical protein